MMQYFGAKSEDELMQNPILQKMMKQFFEAQFKDVNDKGEGKKQNDDTSNMRQVVMVNSQTKGDRVVKGKQIESNVQVIKSPSDTTIYVPALQKKLTPNSDNLINDHVLQ